MFWSVVLIAISTALVIVSRLMLGMLLFFVFCSCAAWVGRLGVCMNPALMFSLSLCILCIVW